MGSGQERRSRYVHGTRLVRRAARFLPQILAVLVVCGALFAGWQPNALLAGSASANVLIITKTVVEDPLVGGTVTYKISVRNESFSGNKAYNLDVIDDLPEGTSFVSSTSPVAPVLIDISPNYQRLHFQNITDLAIDQTYSFEITATLAKVPNTLPMSGNKFSGIESPNTQLVNKVQAIVSADPRVTAPVATSGALPVAVSAPLVSSGMATSPGPNEPPVVALPFKLKKVVVQSTGVNQVTGGCTDTGEGRKFSYTLTATNTTLDQTIPATITDVLPYGVEYCGLLEGPTPNIAYNEDGETILTFSNFSLTPGQERLFRLQVAVPYIYPATRPGGVTISDGRGGTFINDGTPFTNTATMVGSYKGTSYSTSPQTATILAKYVTISKSSDKSTVVYNDIVTYTLTPQTSANYTASNIYIIDTLPSGEDYQAGSSYVGSTPVAPTSAAVTSGFHTPCAGSDPAANGVYLCSNGTTEITWGPFYPTGDLPLSANSAFSVTFKAEFRPTYRLTGQPAIVAGDSLTNNVRVVYDAASISAHTSPNAADSVSNGRVYEDIASAGHTTTTPKLTKTITAVRRGDGGVSQGVVASGGKSATAAVGDIVTFDLYYNAATVATDQQNIVVSDFLPSNYEYVPGSTTFPSGNYTGAINGQLRGSGTPNPLCYPSCGVGGVLVYEIGDLINGVRIIPQYQDLTIRFNAVVVSGSATGANTNLGKLSGNASTYSGGAAYSERDQAEVAIIRPNLVINKTNDADIPTVGSEVVTYTITVTNNGASTAYRIADIVDTLPNSIRYLSGDGVYTPGTGFGGGTVRFTMPAGLPRNVGSPLTFTYTAVIEPSPPVGSSLVNRAEIASYASQPVGVDKYATYGAVSATSTVYIAGDKLRKEGAVVQPQVNGAGGRVTIGDQVAYTLTYRIPSNTTVLDGEIRECLPLGYHYVPGTYQGTVTVEPSGTVLPGGTVLPTLPPNSPGPVPADGDNACAADQEELSFPFDVVTNVSGVTFVLEVKLTAVISGLDQDGNQRFTTYPAANNTRPDSTNPNLDVPNVNSGYVYVNGGTEPLATATTPSNGDRNSNTNLNNNDVYIPHLTIDQSLSRVVPAGVTWTDGPLMVVPSGSSVYFLLELTNDGGAPAHDIAPLIDLLPPGLTYDGAFQSNSSCQEAALVPGVTTSARTVTIPVTSPRDAGTTLYVCLRATVNTPTAISTTLTNTLTLGAGTGDKYYSAPDNDGNPNTAPVREGYVQNDSPTEAVRTPDVITFDPLPNQTYGAAPISLAPNSPFAAESSGDRPLDYSVTGPCQLDGTPPSVSIRITGVGTCNVTASQRDDNLAPNVTRSFVIDRATVTVRPANQTIQFGQTPPCVYASGYPQGLVYGEQPSVLGTLTCTTLPATITALGTYPLVPGGLIANNYNIIYQNGAVTVTQCRPTITFIIQPNQVIQYSDLATFRAVVTNCGGPIFPIGPVQFGIGAATVGSDGIDENGLAEISIQVMQNVGKPMASARFTSNDIRFASVVAVPLELTINPENAIVSYSAAARTSFPVNNLTKKGSVQLVAQVTDSAGVAGSPDTQPGDIRLARVTFVNVNTNAPVNAACANLPVTLTSLTNLKVGTASCTFQSAAATYDIKMVVSNYYIGESQGTTRIIVGSGSSSRSAPFVQGYVGTHDSLLLARREDA